MAGSSPAMTKTPIFAMTAASSPHSLLGSRFRPSIFLLFGGLASGGRVGFCEHTGDCAAQDADAHPVGDVDRGLLRIVDPRHGSDNAAPGHDPVTTPQRIEHRPVILGLSLL